MTKIKLILGGITGAVGLTSAALVPSLLTSSADPTFENKVNSGGRAVPKSWASGTKKSTSFRSFGDAFAPFLVDVDKTDDAFWEERAEKTKEKEFDHGKIFYGWENITDKQVRISKIKEGCRSFQGSSLKNSDTTDVSRIMHLCGIYNSEGKDPGFANIQWTKGPSLSERDSLTAGEVCGLLTFDTVKGSCEEIKAQN